MRDRHLRVLARLALLVMSGVLAAPGSATAASPAVTAQAQAADAAFLAYAPPPAQGAGALCLVDTGVHANPDTTPGLVSATELDGSSGDDSDPNGHGTTMAMIAGAAGIGMVGAWPQLKIVSVRATSEPFPGTAPTFEFNDYAEGVEHCLQQQARSHIDVIDLALSSSVPPSSEQAQTLQSAIGQASSKNVAIVAAAGNRPGSVQEPASEPGIFAVGAFTAQPDQASDGPTGSPCSFSANEGLTFYGPGCGLDEADPFTDQPLCCGNGTSQASAFTAAVIVALMSYDPGLTYSHAEQLLVSTATNGDLDVAAAFDTAGLRQIVADGEAATPKASAPVPSSTPARRPTRAIRRPGQVRLRLLHWRRGRLTIQVAALPPRATLRVELSFAHHTRSLVTRGHVLRVQTRRPRVVQLQLMLGKTMGPMLKVVL